MFEVGEKVEFVKYPSLRGVVREILPAEDDLPETVSVDMFIPAGELGFQFTGITENFWCAPEDLRGLTQRAVDCAYCHCSTAIVRDGVNCLNCGRVYKSHSH